MTLTVRRGHPSLSQTIAGNETESVPDENELVVLTGNENSFTHASIQASLMLYLPRDLSGLISAYLKDKECWFARYTELLCNESLKRKWVLLHNPPSTVNLVFRDSQKHCYLKCLPEYIHKTEGAAAELPEETEESEYCVFGIPQNNEDVSNWIIIREKIHKRWEVTQEKQSKKTRVFTTVVTTRTYDANIDKNKDLNVLRVN